MNIKYVYTPQESIYDVYNYQFNQACLKISHKLKMSETEEVTNDSYYDIGSLELDKQYETEHPLINIEAVDGEWIFNLLHALPTQEEYEAFEPETFDVQFEDFEVPKDAEIIQLEELIIPEEEPVVDQAVELLKANTKIDELKSYVNQAKEENETLVLSAIEMMMEMMQSST